MQTSLWDIAQKAKKERKHRFRNLFGMLTYNYLLSGWRLLNKSAAAGVDRISAREYEKNLSSNVMDVWKRVKENRYKAKLVRRKYIDKGNGKRRPLGIPAIDDKVLQRAVAGILEAIHEQDFLRSSYGYRPNRGAKDAIQELTEEMERGNCRYVVEADIRGYFDHIDHGWILEMLKQRIDDKPFLHLIEKWLKAGILEEDGKVSHPENGTPQGGIVSPILANVYLHYALDLWFEGIVKKQLSGKARLFRYADDFVVIFEKKADAEKFYGELAGRLSKFKLEVATEKTRIIDMEEAGAVVEFLGFELRKERKRKWGKKIARRTMSKKLAKAKENFKQWIRENRSEKLPELMKVVKAKLRGHYNYYGLSGNYRSLEEYYREVTEAVRKWLNRRSQKQSYTVRQFLELLRRQQIPRPRIPVQKQLRLQFA